jgi:hypothetical protein
VGVGPHQGYLLRLFGAHVTQAFGHTPYLVGSALTEKRGWRDVDVRLIVPDDEHEALDAGRRAHELAWCALGREMTGGLPIDFQIQSQTEANRDHPGPRSALVIRGDELVVAR